MKALLLAAGLGTRLRPFTFFRAKPSLPLLNVPFIQYALQYLCANHVNEVVINLHAHPDSVQATAGRAYGGMSIRYSHEPEILGTAGAIGKAAPMLGDDPFVVLNSDMLTDIPLQVVTDQHLRSGALVTLVVMKAENFPDYSALYFGGNPLKLTGIQRGSGPRYHYSGLQIVNPEITSLIPPEKKTEVFTDIYPRLIGEGRIYGVIYEGLWKEIGTLKDYLKTSLELSKEPLPSHLQPSGTSLSLISLNATLESNAEVIESIIMEGARVKEGSRIEHSIIGWNVTASGNLRNVALARGVLPWHIM